MTTEPYLVVTDGTHLSRTGKRIPGAYWAPDKRNRPVIGGCARASGRRCWGS